jgi:hypothetical protein
MRAAELFPIYKEKEDLKAVYTASTGDVTTGRVRTTNPTPLRAVKYSVGGLIARSE